MGKKVLIRIDGRTEVLSLEESDNGAYHCSNPPLAMNKEKTVCTNISTGDPIENWIVVGELTGNEHLRGHVINAFEHAIDGFSYYDRKEDEDLSVEDLKIAINEGHVKASDLIPFVERLFE